MNIRECIPHTPHTMKCKFALSNLQSTLKKINSQLTVVSCEEKNIKV